MEFNSIRSPVRAAKVLLVASLLTLGSVADAQTGEEPSGVDHMPVTSQALPNDPGRSLTAVVVAFAPGARAASHRHAGIVFAYVLEGTIRSQLNGGEVVEYHAGQSWVEPPGAKHTLTENPSQTMPARLLAVFVAPTGAQPTTYDK
jgi:quercetin dioxygenase-like cupin family protein